jgi:hypothetical protein
VNDAERPPDFDLGSWKALNAAQRRVVVKEYYDSSKPSGVAARLAAAATRRSSKRYKVHSRYLLGSMGYMSPEEMRQCVAAEAVLESDGSSTCLPTSDEHGPVVDTDMESDDSSQNSSDDSGDEYFGGG